MLHHVTVFPGEDLSIGSDITVYLIDVGGGRVRLGFEAPPSVPIYREELYLAQHLDDPRTLNDSRQRARTPELAT